MLPVAFRLGCVAVLLLWVPAANAEDQPSLTGDWQASSVRCSGEDCQAAAGLRCTFTDNQISAQYGEKSVSVSYQLDPGKSPAVISVTKGDSKLWHGIFKREGNTLTLCVVPAGTDLPTELETKQGDERVLIVLERK